MAQELTTLRLRMAGVSRQAIHTTLAKFCPVARSVVEAINQDDLALEYIGYYIRPANYARSSAAEINKSRLVYDLMYKELILSGKSVIIYPVHEMLKDAQDRYEGQRQSRNVQYPFGMGPRAEQHSLSTPSADEVKISTASVVFIPDFLVSEKNQIEVQAAENCLSWIRRCVDKHNIVFVFYGILDLRRSANVWPQTLASYVQENLIEIPIVA